MARAVVKLPRVIKAAKVLAVAKAVQSKAVKERVSPNSTSIKIRTRIEIRKVPVGRAVRLVSRKHHKRHLPQLSKN